MKIYLFLIVLITFFMLTGCKKTQAATVESDKKVTDVKKVEEVKKVEDVKKVEIVKKQVKSRNDGIVKILPETTNFLMKVNSLENGYKHLAVTKDSILGYKIEEVEEMVKELGLNLLNLEELIGYGVDIKGELGFAVSNIKWNSEKKEPTADFIVFIPITDPTKIIETVKTKITTVQKDVKVEVKDNVTKIFDDKHWLYFITKDKYLLVVMNITSDAKDTVESIVSGKTQLLNAKTFKSITSKVGSAEDLFLYGNVTDVVNANYDILKKDLQESPDLKEIGNILDYIKEYGSFAASLNLQSTDFNADGVIETIETSSLLKILKDVKFNKDFVLSFKEHPIFLFSLGMNAKEYYKMFEKILSGSAQTEMKEGMAEANKMLEIDIEKDIIDNIEGNMNFGIYDGASINQMNYNAVMTLNFKDGKKASEVLDKLLTKIPAEKTANLKKDKVGDIEVYVYTEMIFSLYFAIVKDSLVVSSSKVYFEKAITGTVKEGFTSKIADKLLVSYLTNNVNSFYISVEEGYKVFTNFKAQMGQIDASIETTIQKFQYLIATSYVENTAFYSNFTVKTKFEEPFFLELAKIIKTMQEK